MGHSNSHYRGSYKEQSLSISTGVHIVFRSNVGGGFVVANRVLREYIKKLTVSGGGGALE